MNIGIVIRGISLGKSNLGNGTDWKIVKDNIIENFINPFKEHHKVKVYLTTYENDELNDIIDFYKPENVLILPFEGSNQRNTLLQSMVQIRNEDLDFILTTRFDVRWFQKVANLNIDYNKFNFLYKEVEPEWTRNKFVSDIIFGFPKCFLEPFMQAIINEHNNPSRTFVTDMHNAYKRMIEVIGIENLHFIHDEPHPDPITRTPENPPGDNHFYRIIRS